MPSFYKKSDSIKPVPPHHLTEDELNKYVSDEYMFCLICGRRLRMVGGSHLKTHDMTEDDYRQMYGIPWTRGLACKETVSIHSEISTTLREEGVIPKNGPDWTPLVSAERRPKLRQDWARKHAMRNLEKLNEGKNGEVTKERQQRCEKYQSMSDEEKRQYWASRPQCKAGAEMLKSFWKGRKQTPEHKAKRLAAMMRTRELKKNADNPPTDAS